MIEGGDGQEERSCCLLAWDAIKMEGKCRVGFWTLVVVNKVRDKDQQPASVLRLGGSLGGVNYELSRVALRSSSYNVHYNTLFDSLVILLVALLLVRSVLTEPFLALFV